MNDDEWATHMAELESGESYHRWSGWPGAVCLRCGIFDALEQAMALDLYDPFTQEWADSPEAR